MNAEGLSELDLVNRLCPRKVRVAACGFKRLKTYFILFCVWVCFCGLSPFFYNSFLFTFFLSVFFVVLFVWAITYPSFSCPFINNRNKIQEWVGERFMFFCFRRVLSSDWKSKVSF